MREEMPPEQAVARWLDDFPEDAVQERIEILRAANEQLQSEIELNHAEAERLTRLLHAQAQLATQTSPNGAGPDLALLALPTEEETRGRPSSKREAVRRVLEADPSRPWHVHEIRYAIVRKGWLADSSKDMHSLDQTLSSMAKDGELLRPEGKRGLYQLAIQARTDE